MYEIYYEKTSTDLLQTICPVKGCLTGGYYCVNCEHYGGKNRKEQYVKCSLNHATKK